MKIKTEKTHYGYLQKTSYSHPDQYDESVITLTSPLASIIASDTHIITVLLLGNRNSGKSTFIHSFTNKKDMNFFELLVELPIINSTFVNTRFVSGEDPYIDEPPFIDTDVARGTILFNREDFEFVLRENEIDPMNLHDRTRFVLINFIEIGGDHLDRIISNNDEKKEVRELISQTKRIIEQTPHMVYFLNFEELFISKSNDISLKSFEQISSRISYLTTEFPLIRSINFVISRYSEKLADEINQEKLLIKIKEKIKNDINIGLTNSTFEIIHQYLEYLNKRDKWGINIEIFTGDHLFFDDSLNVKGIMKTFCHLFSKKIIYSEELSQSQVILHLLNFFQKKKNEMKEDVYWITDKDFEEYIANLEFKELPESIIYQNYKQIKGILIQNNYCIHGNETKEPQFKLIIQTFNQSKNKEENWTFKLQNQIISNNGFRFPLFDLLFKYIYQFVMNNIPVEFWFKENQFIFSNEARKLSIEIFRELEKEITRNLTLFFEEGGNQDFLIRLIEDYFIGQNIINKEIGKEIRIPINFYLSSTKFFNNVQFFEIDQSTSTNEWKVILPLKLTK